MAKLAVFVVFVLVAIIVTEASVNGDCPLSSQHTSCAPKCLQNHECAAKNEICCPNLCNAKSCVRPKPGSNYGGGTGGSSSGYKGTSASGTYCGNVKCSSYEKCDTDRTTKRPKCVRA